MIVLDASALVDVVVGAAPREWVLDRIASEDVVAPAHQPAEVLSALTRMERAGILDSAGVELAAGHAVELSARHEALDSGLIRDALGLRTSLRISDALYVALARRHDVPLVTTDRRLARSVAPCRILAPPGVDASTP